MTGRRLLTVAAVSTILAVAATVSLPLTAPAQTTPVAEPLPVTAGVAPPPGPYAPSVDVLHYDVEMGISDTASWFAGRTTLRVVVKDPSVPIPIDFTGIPVLGVLVNGRPVEATHERGVLHVPLPSGIASGDTIRVAVAYRGVPDDALALQTNLHGAPSAFVDNWPNRTRFWMPSVDHPSDKATVRFTVHAPAGWKVVANGHRVSGPRPTPAGAPGPPGDRRTWIYEALVPIPTYTMVVGAADMVVRPVGTAACGAAPASRRTDGCVEVTWWSFPEDTIQARQIFKRAADMVDFFTRTVGPFPYEKLANVQSSTRFGGMENASAIFYTERGWASGRLTEGTVAHEIAHQWFGDAVTEADWRHLWLSEGFATYFGALYFEHAEGPDDFRSRMERSRQRYLAGDVTGRPIVDPAVTDLFALLNDNNYPKGGWVLHMLRGVLGDETFFRGIREYYRRFVHGNAVTADFQGVMERVSGRDLEWFFHQWIYEPGYPILSVEDRWLPDEGGPGGTLEVSVRQLQDPSWPRFRLPLDLAWGDRTERVVVEGAESVFRFSFEGRPPATVLDPGGWILRGDAR